MGPDLSGAHLGAEVGTVDFQSWNCHHPGMQPNFSTKLRAAQMGWVCSTVLHPDVSPLVDLSSANVPAVAGLPLWPKGPQEDVALADRRSACRAHEHASASPQGQRVLEPEPGLSEEARLSPQQNCYSS